MTSSRGALGRDVAVYGLATVLVQIVAFGTTPVYTRLLGPSVYGILELLSVIVSFVITALFDGLGVASVRLYVTDPPEERPVLLATGLVGTVGATLAGAIVAGATAHPLARLVFGTTAASTALVAAAVYLPIGVAARFGAEVLRMQRRPWPFLLSSVLVALVGGGIAIALVAGAGEGAEGVYYGMAIGAVAGLVASLVAARGAIALRVSMRHLRRLVALGGPLAISALAGWSLVLVDRLILVHFVSLRQIGFYGLANRLAGILLIATYAFGTAWTPYILGLYAEDPDAEARIRADVLRHLLAAMAVIAVAVGLFSREAVRVIAGARYLPAAATMPTLALATLFFSTLTVVQVPFLIEQRTSQMARLSLAAAAVNIAACFALIPVWGIQGAAIATVAGFGVQAALYYRQAQTLRRAPYDGRRLLAILVLAVPFIAGGWWSGGSLLAAVGVKIIVLVVFAGLLVVLRLVDVERLKVELQMIWRR
ncbi:MAG TPA: oligosaccharide flippase family protein [Acidimicrobiales bacterium]|jgi:O-antigen/teichoic acid export membrane protein|nr:oligosaccharide flippase family protein [Acidimicrobiales bacterium]